ncbi:MAG: hypothetical protein LIV11_02475 [Bacillota bacterium]|nr:hypothetical protein [Bacillota bacterium]
MDKMKREEYLDRWTTIVIKIVITGVLLFWFTPQYPNATPTSYVVNRVMEGIIFYSCISYFGGFFTGGGIISGLISTSLVLAVMFWFLENMEAGILKSILLILFCFGGLLTDILVIIAATSNARKEQKEAEAELIQRMHQEAEQKALDQERENRPLKELKHIIEQYYASEDKGAQLFSQTAYTVKARNLDPSVLQNFVDEHTNNASAVSVIMERIREEKLSADDIPAFRDRISQCYTENEVIIRKLTAYYRSITE